MRMLLLLVGVLLSAANGAAQESLLPDKARIRQLIDELGNNAFAVREAAHRQLTQFVEQAADELGEATESKDAEQARRANQILGWSDAAIATHRIVDTLDRPIKTARFVIKQGAATQFGFADRLGRFAVPDPNNAAATDIIVEARLPQEAAAGIEIVSPIPVIPVRNKRDRRAVRTKEIQPRLPVRVAAVGRLGAPAGRLAQPAAVAPALSLPPLVPGGAGGDFVDHAHGNTGMLNAE